MTSADEQLTEKWNDHLSCAVDTLKGYDVNRRPFHIYRGANVDASRKWEDGQI